MAPPVVEAGCPGEWAKCTPTHWISCALLLPRMYSAVVGSGAPGWRQRGAWGVQLSAPPPAGPPALCRRRGCAARWWASRRPPARPGGGPPRSPPRVGAPRPALTPPRSHRPLPCWREHTLMVIKTAPSSLGWHQPMLSMVTAAMSQLVQARL